MSFVTEYRIHGVSCEQFDYYYNFKRDSYTTSQQYIIHLDIGETPYFQSENKKCNLLLLQKNKIESNTTFGRPIKTCVEKTLTKYIVVSSGTDAQDNQNKTSGCLRIL